MTGDDTWMLGPLSDLQPAILAGDRITVHHREKQDEVFVVTAVEPARNGLATTLTAERVPAIADPYFTEDDPEQPHAHP